MQVDRKFEEKSFHINHHWSGREMKAVKEAESGSQAEHEFRKGLVSTLLQSIIASLVAKHCEFGSKTKLVEICVSQWIAVPNLLK